MTDGRAAAPLPRADNGFALMLAATAVAGVAGYLVTWLVFRLVGPAGYAQFAVFWGALYLAVGALSGVQQEVTRASTAVESGGSRRLRDFGAVAAATVLAAILATAPLWASAVFADRGWSLVLPLAFGAASYVVVAVLAGALYGLTRWRALAVMVAGDAVLRLVGVGVGALLTSDVTILAWLVAIPFPLTIAVVWVVIRRSVIGRVRVDVSGGRLTWNVARTMVAAASTAVMVSGFPLLIGVVAGDVDPVLVGQVVFTITLARAPLIVTLTALQGVLVVRLRDAPESARRVLTAVVGVIAAGALVLALGALLAGPQVFAFVGGEPSTLDGGFIAALVASSALVALLTACSALALSRSRHALYAAGWMASAAATIVLMSLPIDFVQRVPLALIAAPAIGLAVQVTGLLVTRGQRSSR